VHPARPTARGPQSTDTRRPRPLRRLEKPDAEGRHPGVVTDRVLGTGRPQPPRRTTGGTAV